jgi:predicted dehydrogenase
VEGDLGGNIEVPWPYYLEIRYFVDCVREGKDPELASGEIAREFIEFISYAKCSLEKKKTIEIQRSWASVERE